MNSARLDLLLEDGIGFDLETDLIQPGLVSPPIVLGSDAVYRNGQVVGEILSKADARATFEEVLQNPRYTLCGANIAYDVMCLLVDFVRRGIDITSAVFAMYDPDCTAILGEVNGRVLDILLFEQLHAIALGHLGLDPQTMRKITDPDTGRPGRYSLREVTRQVRGCDNAKANDLFRLSYALFHDVPVDQLPFEARTYPIDDAVNTLGNALGQAGHTPSLGIHDWQKINHYPWLGCRRCGHEFGKDAGECWAKERRLNAHEVSRQTYSAFCLNLGAAWGYRINQQKVDELEKKYDTEHNDARKPFEVAGVIRDDGTENQSKLKELVALAYGTDSLSQCATCTGTGKVPSAKTEGRTSINCKACDGTGLEFHSSVPRAEKGGIGKSRDVLAESGDEFLMSYGEYGEDKKIKTVYIPYLRNTDRDKVAHPDVPRVLRPNTIVETGRVSYDGATMLLPRAGGVRDCIEARPGYYLSSVDYKAGELVTHAQSCIWIVGASRLAEALNRGLDAHLALAATIMGISYEKAIELKAAGDKTLINTRQVAKPPNFGFPGRMGAAKLVQQQRKQMDVHTPHRNGPTWLDDAKTIRGYKGLRFCIMMNVSETCGDTKVSEWKGRALGGQLCKKCIEICEDLRKSWLMQWPENGPYFDFVKKVDESGQPIIQHRSKRLRGFRQGLVDDDGNPINSGNAIANGYFQGLLADAAKNAHMAATRECYDRTVRVESHTTVRSRFEGCESPLYGSRIPQFQHDELIGEHPISIASEAAWRNSEIMCESLRLMCPDLASGKAIEAAPALMLCLLKGAEARYERGGDKPADGNDRLVPWVPKK